MGLIVGNSAAIDGSVGLVVADVELEWNDAEKMCWADDSDVVGGTVRTKK